MDIFSLGCLLYYILTAGQHPFGTSALSRGANILQDSPIIVEDINFPKEFQLIRLMLSGDPKRRPRIDETLCVFSQHLADTNAQIPGNLIVANKEEVGTNRSTAYLKIMITTYYYKDYFDFGLFYFIAGFNGRSCN